MLISLGPTAIHHLTPVSGEPICIFANSYSGSFIEWDPGQKQGLIEKNSCIPIRASQLKLYC